MTKTSNLNIEEMTQAGLQAGHFVSKLHPKMKDFVTGTKNNVHQINLEKTVEEFTKALYFIESLISQGKTMLVVGTKVPIKEMTKQMAIECGLPYVSERWLGGFFTNFETLIKRITYFKNLEREKQTGMLEKYTKKERIKIDKELVILSTKFGGIKELSKLPDAVLVLDMQKDELAATEAKKRGIKVIAICDTNINPDVIDYLIPANDDAISSVKYILEKIKEVVLRAKKEVK